MIRRQLPALLELPQIHIQLHRRLDRLNDHRIPAPLADAKPQHDRHCPRRRHPSPLKLLEAQKLQSRVAPPTPSANSVPDLVPRVFVTLPRIELEVVSAPFNFKSPYLPVRAVL